jgi:hypothetical protein
LSEIRCQYSFFPLFFTLSPVVLFFLAMYVLAVGGVW